MRIKYEFSKKCYKLVKSHNFIISHLMSLKIHSLILVCFFVLLSCADDTMPFPQETNLSHAINKSTELVAIDNYIRKNHPVESRSNEFKLEPFMLNGDTVMFIANYGNHGGWEIFSNTTSSPMLLVKSEEGTFEDVYISSSHPVREIIDFCAQKIWDLKNLRSSEIIPVNDEWKLYNPNLNNLINSTAAVSSESVNDYEDYMFIMSSDVTTTKTVYEPKGGRLKTKWGQGLNFNQYTPFFEDDANKHSYVGCVPVAFGQFFYHSHYNFGQPLYAVTEATYNSSDNTYSFSGASSNIWDSFNTESYLIYFPDEMKSTAIFLGNIGVSIGVSYGKRYHYANDEKKHDGTGSDLKNRTCINFFKDQTNLNVEVVSLDEKYICSNLKKGYPIVAQVTHVYDNAGHAFIIDHYDTEMTKFYNYYTPTILPPDAEWPEISSDITLDELKALFGEIIVEEVITTKAFYQMNWGFYGDYDDLKFDRWCVEWEVDEYVYDSNSAEMYNIK